jgi:leader peptidase (prepilin peptidase)/N-methyltransferase
LKFGLSLSFFVHVIYVGALIVVTFIDLDYTIIPDKITLPLIGFGYMISWIPNTTVTHWESLIGILVGGGFLYLTAFFYQVIAGKEGMGGGDIKLMAMVGSIMGPWKVFMSIFFASFVGSIISIIYLRLSGKGREHPIPFGPFLAFGSVLTLFFGDYALDILFPMHTIYFSSIIF